MPCRVRCERGAAAGSGRPHNAVKGRARTRGCEPRPCGGLRRADQAPAEILSMVAWSLSRVSEEIGADPVSSAAACWPASLTT